MDIGDYTTTAGDYLGIAAEKNVLTKVDKDAGEMVQIHIRFVLDHFFDESRGEWIAIEDLGLVVDGFYQIVAQRKGVNAPNVRAMTRCFGWDGNLLKVEGADWMSKRGPLGERIPRSLQIKVVESSNRRGQTKMFATSFAPKEVKVKPANKHKTPYTVLERLQYTYGKSLFKAAVSARRKYRIEQDG